MSHRVWHLTSEKFAELVAQSKTWGDLSDSLGYRKYYYPQDVKRRIEKEGLDVSHFERNHTPHPQAIRELVPLDELLVEGKYVASSKLKRKLIRAKLLENVCILCGVGAEWNGMPLVLQLDHINGNHNDNRIENLRVLCPNCHTQTSTFCGRMQKIKRLCETCGGPRHRSSKYCQECYRKSPTKYTNCIDCNSEKPSNTRRRCKDCAVSKNPKKLTIFSNCIDCNSEKPSNTRRRCKDCAASKNPKPTKQPQQIYQRCIDCNSEKPSNTRCRCKDCAASKNPKLTKQPPQIYQRCIDCNSEKTSNTSPRCNTCAKSKTQRTKRPPKDQLLQEIREFGYCGTGRIYGVSDNAIRKWVKNYPVQVDKALALH